MSEGFTPGTYTIDLSGWGGELIAGTIDPVVYEYLSEKNIDLNRLAMDPNFEFEDDVPDEVLEFDLGAWYEYNDLCHCSGIAFRSEEHTSELQSH